MRNPLFKAGDFIERKDPLWKGHTEAEILHVDKTNEVYLMKEKGEIFKFPFDFLEEVWQVKQ